MDPALEIPVIDFEPFLRGSSHDQLNVAHQIDEAFSKHGFIYLTNHGIPQEQVDKAFQWTGDVQFDFVHQVLNLSLVPSLLILTLWLTPLLCPLEKAKRFYTLPLTERLELVAADSSQSQGYTALMTEIVRGRPAVKESFGIGNPNDNEKGSLWPPEDSIPGFKDFLLGFYHNCTGLTQTLLECLSLALNLPRNRSFESFHTRSLFTMDLIRYPSIDAQALRSGTQTRMPAHSDIDVITLLFQEAGADASVPGGLEIAVVGSSELGTSASYEKTGTWIHVPPKRGTVVVNVGYLLKRWTNARWRSAVHRVGEPPNPRKKATPEWSMDDANEEGMARVPERFSIPFFSMPDPETIIEALPGTWSSARPKKWGALKVQDYLRKKREEINLV